MTSEVQLQYGIIFDAGSSGSRIHVFTYSRGGQYGDFHLVEDDLVKSKPGLSASAKDPATAGASLTSLLKHATEKIPPANHASTPVFLMATAGLRLLGDNVAEEILNSVRKTLAETPFLFKPEWAYILSGLDEGVLGWLTVNYLLDKLSSTSLSTVGIMDLGGGSVQFVHGGTPGGELVEPNKEVMFAGRKHRLHAVSHIGFGLDEARKRVQVLVEQDSTKTAVAEHPCFPVGFRSSDPAFIGKGSYEGCATLYLRLLNGNGACDSPLCSLNRVSLPSVPDVVVGFSYFFDRTAAVGLLDSLIQMKGMQNMTINDMRSASKKMCALESGQAEDRFKDCEDADKWMNFCGDATFMVVLLEHGFGIHSNKALTMAKTIKDVELVWTLGAMINYVGTLPTLTAHQNLSEL